MEKKHQYERPIIEAPAEPHLACLLLLDTSGAMAGAPIVYLNKAINDFKEKLSLDKAAKKRVDVAIVEFNDHANILQDFQPIGKMESLKLEASGLAAMGEGINFAIDLIKQRKRLYNILGITAYVPWIFMISNVASTDDITEAAKRIAEEENKGKYGHLKFWALGVHGYDKNTLFQLTKRVFELSDYNFEEIFSWLAEYISYTIEPHMNYEFRSPLPSNVSKVTK